MAQKLFNIRVVVMKCGDTDHLAQHNSIQTNENDAGNQTFISST